MYLQSLLGPSLRSHFGTEGTFGSICSTFWGHLSSLYVSLAAHWLQFGRSLIFERSAGPGSGGCPFDGLERTGPGHSRRAVSSPPTSGGGGTAIGIHAAPAT